MRGVLKSEGTTSKLRLLNGSISDVYKQSSGGECGDNSGD
jgi:hypothetical protein